MAKPVKPSPERSDSEASGGAPSPPAKARERLARGPMGVGNVVGRVLKPALGRRGLSDGALYARWADVVGPELSRYALPVKIARSGDGPGVLHLRLTSGSAAALIHHQTPALIARINRFFGREVIGDLRVMQGLAPKTRKPAAAEKPPALTDQPQSPVRPPMTPDDITDPDLRAAFERFAATMARKG